MKRDALVKMAGHNFINKLSKKNWELRSLEARGDKVWFSLQKQNKKLECYGGQDFLGNDFVLIDK